VKSDTSHLRPFLDELRQGQLATQMGGTLTAESELGKGSSFTLALLAAPE
jgi:signal transduction histidine kinase